MTTIDLSSYKKLYIQTAKEYVKTLAKSCRRLLENANDSSALGDMYISSHSLRTQSEVMGYTKIATITGMLEKIIKKHLDGNGQISSKLLEVINDASKDLQVSLQYIEKEDKEKDLTTVFKKLESLYGV